MSLRADQFFAVRLRLVLGLCLICHGAVAKETHVPVGHQDAAAETRSVNSATPTGKPAVTLATVPSPKEIDPALRETADVLASTNIIEQHPTQPGSSLQADLEAMLDCASRIMTLRKPPLRMS